MSKENATVHALILDASSNDAEQTLNILRNTGMAVRATQIVNEEELIDALNRQSWELFLGRNNCAQLTLQDALKIIRDSGRDIPTIEIGSDYNAENTLSCMQAGAQSFAPDENDELLCLLVAKELRHLEDRRRRKQAEAQLTETENRCELLLANSRDAIAYIHDGMHIYANHSYLDLFGYEEWDDLECMPIMDMIGKDFRSAFKCYLREQTETPDNSKFKFEGIKSDGEKFEGYLSLSTASYDNEPCIQVLITTQTYDSELQEKLLELSSNDSLTGLYNRESLMHQLTETVSFASSTGKNATLAYLEMDQFDEWEDTFGLKASDEILVGASNWLKSKTDDTDIVSRISNHAFAILRPDTSIAQFKDFANDLLTSFAKTLLEANKKTLTGTLSIGLAPINERSPDASQVLHDAHAATLRATSGGGNKCCIFESAIDGESASMDRETKESVRKIQEAMQSGRIFLLYQPIVKLHGERQEFFQALLRIRDESGAPVTLDKAFPISQSSPLALKLDYWVIAQSMRALKEHRDKSKSPTRFFIQLSATAIEEDELVLFISKSLKASRLPADSIIFQIDEGDATSRLKRVIELAGELEKLGIAIAVNHFGAGVASTLLLERLSAKSLQFVKIAGDVVQSELSSGDDMKKLKDLISSAKQFNRQVIVPMIEEAQSLAQIWPLGIDYVQGYYLSPPSSTLHFDFDEAGL